MKKKLTNSIKTLRLCMAIIFMMGVSIFAKAASVCPGSAATLNAQAGMNSYSWSNGLGNSSSVSVYPTITTTYTCTEQDVFGGSASESFTVTVLAANDPACINGGGGTGGSGGGTGGTSIGVTSCPGSATTLNAQAAMNSYLWSDGLGNSSSVTVFPTASITYTCTEQDVFGATVIESFIVTVLSANDASCTNGGGGTPGGGTSGGGTSGGGGGSTPADTINACPGDIVTLTADVDKLAYIWDNGLDGSQIQRVSPTATTTYTVLMLNADGSASSHVYVVVVLAANSPLCGDYTGKPCTTKSGKAGLMDCAAKSGSNTTGSGSACNCKATTVKNTTGSSTAKPKTVKNTGKPKGSTGKNKGGHNRLGVNRDVNMNISVIENPFKGDLSLTINSGSDAPSTVEIYDVTGRMVAEDRNVQSNSVFSAKHDLNNGIYFIHVIQAGVTTMTKVVKSGN